MPETQCVLLRVYFHNGLSREYPVHRGGDWRYTEPSDGPRRIVVRPYGRTGARHEIPLVNIQSVMLVKHVISEDA